MEQKQRIYWSSTLNKSDAVEYAVKVWQPSLTYEDSINIERVQKSTLSIILGQNYKSYNHALRELNLVTLCTKTPHKNLSEGGVLEA